MKIRTKCCQLDIYVLLSSLALIRIKSLILFQRVYIFVYSLPILKASPVHYNKEYYTIKMKVHIAISLIFISIAQIYAFV